MKRQKWLTGVVAVMLVASLLLAVVSFVVPRSVRAAGGPQPEVQCPSWSDWYYLCSYCGCPTDYCHFNCMWRHFWDNECNYSKQYLCQPV